jgi:transposase-like protein
MELMRRGRRGRFTAREREQLLAAYRRSGLTQREFAAESGVSLSSLVLWLRKYGRRSPAAVRPPFIALPTGLPAVTSPPRAYAIDFRGGHRLEIARGFDRDELEYLCQFLRGL